MNFIHVGEIYKIVKDIKQYTFFLNYKKSLNNFKKNNPKICL